MSYPYLRIKTALTGDVLTAADYNAEHQNHITNNIPSSIQSYGTSAATMQTQTTPGAVGSESAPTDLAGELARMRFSLAQAKGSKYWYGLSARAISVQDPSYGAVGDDSTDDTTAIQNAINAAPVGGTVFFPAATYKLTATLTLPASINLVGTYTMGSTGGTILHQTGSTPIFTLRNSSSTVSEAQGILIDGFHLKNGTNQLYAENGGVFVTLRNMTFESPSNAGILQRGFVQEWFLRDIEFSGGLYGIYHTATGLKTDHSTLGTPILWDKCNYYSIYAHGQTTNALYFVLPSGTGDGNTFVDLRVVNVAQDGVVMGGGIRGILFNTFSSEGGGYTGSAATAATTATTSAGSANVTVASGTGLTNGSVLTIAGAGTSGADWYPTISSGGGTTALVMTSTAPTAVTAAECVNYLYSDIKFTQSGGSDPSNVTFLNTVLGINVGTGNVRYAIDCAGLLYNNVAVCPTVGRPIYDPASTMNVVGAQAQNCIIRRPPNFLTETFLNTSIGGDANCPRTQIVSPPGKDVTIGLCDSTANQTGTIGKFEVRKADGSRTQLLSIDGTGALSLPQAPLGIASGGTNSATTLGNGKVMVSSGSKIVESTTASINAAGYLIGTVVQAVQVLDTAATSITNTAFQNTTTTASITPHATTHKIRVSVTGTLDASNVGTVRADATLARGGSNLFAANGFASIEGSVTGNLETPCSLVYLDAPASTSSLTYTLQIRQTSGTTVWNNHTGTAIILLEEIAF